jgi:DNA-binding XRE family transcriptional regulator
MPSSTWNRASDEDRRRGAKIQAIRHARGISARTLSEEIKPPLSTGYLYMIENGRKPVPLKLCRRLAAYFGVDVEAITDPGHQAVCEAAR